jgi:hypothetical protein
LGGRAPSRDGDEGDDSYPGSLRLRWNSALDLVREYRPPFDPDTIAAEAAALLRRYGVRKVTMDRWGLGRVDWIRAITAMFSVTIPT